MDARIRIPAIALTIFLLASACTTASDPVRAEAAAERNLPMLPADAEVAPGLEVDVSCSKTERRTPIAVVSWRGSSLRAASQRLDVTVYKDGFEEGEYATVPVTRGGRFEYRSATGLRSTRSA